MISYKKFKKKSYLRQRSFRNNLHNEKGKQPKALKIMLEHINN